jgi:hypothetical protein
MLVAFTRVSGENRIFVGRAHSKDGSKIQIDRRSCGTMFRTPFAADYWRPSGTYRQAIGHVELKHCGRVLEHCGKVHPAFSEIFRICILRSFLYASSIIGYFQLSGEIVYKEI